jgi:hypothetical protein
MIKETSHCKCFYYLGVFGIKKITDDVNHRQINTPFWRRLENGKIKYKHWHMSTTVSKLETSSSLYALALNMTTILLF